MNDDKGRKVVVRFLRVWFWLGAYAHCVICINTHVCRETCMEQPCDIIHSRSGRPVIFAEMRIGIQHTLVSFSVVWPEFPQMLALGVCILVSPHAPRCIGQLSEAQRAECRATACASLWVGSSSEYCRCDQARNGWTPCRALTRSRRPCFHASCG